MSKENPAAPLYTDVTLSVDMSKVDESIWSCNTYASGNVAPTGSYLSISVWGTITVYKRGRYSYEEEVSASGMERFESFQ